MRTDRPIKDFLAEAEDILEAANQALVSIESGQSTGSTDPDIVNALFRSLHSFKGLAGMFGFQAPADLAHKMEYLLDELRLGKLAFSREILDVLFETLALLGHLVQQVGKKSPPDDITSALDRIEEILKIRSSASSDLAIFERVNLDRGLLQVLTEYEEHRLKENIREHKNLFTLKTSFELNDF
jgi:two-component system chemotaxis sensor kinase CheA